MVVFGCVCVGSLVLCVFLLVRGAAALVKASALQARTYSNTLEQHDKFLVAALDSNLKSVAEAVREDGIRQHLSRNGLGPYLGEPGSRIMQEIAAISQNLNVTPEEAARYLQSEIRSRSEVNGG